METLESIYGAYSQGKFWVIATLISLGSALLLFSAFDGTSVNPLFLVLTGIGVCLLPFAIWQQGARKRFFTWLESQWGNLETGAVHPDGCMITFDTPLVRYKVVFSAFLATVSFASRPYVLQHRSAGVAQASFTIFSFVFGWWFLGPEGVVETISAIFGNLRSSDTFTLRELIMKAQNA
jgi:hypothetical protein